MSFHELVTTPFANGINALCWPRTLPGDFGEVVALPGAGEEITALDDARLTSLPVSAAGRAVSPTGRIAALNANAARQR